jgi:L-rhamnose-H+ transport protein
LHIASSIIISTLWGIALKEWERRRRKNQVVSSVPQLVRVSPTLIVAYGNYARRSWR